MVEEAADNLLVQLVAMVETVVFLAAVVAEAAAHLVVIHLVLAAMALMAR